MCKGIYNMPKIPQTGGSGIIKFLPIQGESAYNFVAGQIEPKMLNIFHNISVNAPSTYSDFKYNIQQAQHQDETQKEIYSTFNLDFKNYSLEIFIKILNQVSDLENQLNPPMIMTNLSNPSSEAIIEIMSLKHPLDPGRNYYFYITLINPQEIEVYTIWDEDITRVNYHGIGDYQTQYIDFKIYGAELMIGDTYEYVKFK